MKMEQGKKIKLINSMRTKIKFLEKDLNKLKTLEEAKENGNKKQTSIVSTN